MTPSEKHIIEEVKARYAHQNLKNWVRIQLGVLLPYVEWVKDAEKFIHLCVHCFLLLGGRVALIRHAVIITRSSNAHRFYPNQIGKFLVVYADILKDVFQHLVQVTAIDENCSLIHDTSNRIFEIQSCHINYYRPLRTVATIIAIIYSTWFKNYLGVPL